MVARRLQRPAVALAFVLASCTGTLTPKTAGQACVASSECGSGLLCDDVSHVCQGMGTVDADIPKPDAPKKYDAGSGSDHKDAAVADAPPD
jgi:hypothetical protein